VAAQSAQPNIKELEMPIIDDAAMDAAIAQLEEADSDASWAAAFQALWTACAGARETFETTLIDLTGLEDAEIDAIVARFV
jgi:hypothetical protein